MKTAIYKGSIEKKFLKAIFFLVSIVVLSGYIIFVSWYIHDQKEDRFYLSEHITKILAQDFVRLILLDDLNTAADLTTKLRSFKEIEKVVLYNNNRKKIFKYVAKEKALHLKDFTTHNKLYYNDEPYGELYFTFEVESLWEIFQDDFLLLLLLLTIFLTISLILARTYAKYFSKPLLYLVDFLEKIEFQDNIQVYKIRGNYDDEIGKLYEEINLMFAKIAYFFQQKEEAQKQLSFITQYDALTGLLNKNGLLKALKKTLKEDNSHWHIMLYIKLTNLKGINHAYGYKCGDLLLRELTKKIKEDFADSNISARMGMGDFVLYYRSEYEDKHEALLKAQSISDALIGILSKSIVIDDNVLVPEVYIGIDIFKNEDDPLKILRHTNIALELGRESQQKIAYFDESNGNYAKDMFNVSEGLVIALQEDQLELFYQLQYDENENIFGAEALIRWRHPKFGLLTPYKFISIAERTDLIVDIGNWVIEATCKQLQQWQNNEKTKNWVVAINVSAKQFKKDNFVKNLYNIVTKYQVNPKNIKIELLESLFVENQDKVAIKMHELKSLNFQLSLDDFGTGFSSLQYLKNFPLDQIKIDQSFIMNMFNNEKDIQIIKSVIYLGSLLNMEVIAEGVEEKEHYDKLKTLGCRYFQGYYFARPESIATINNTVLK